jgi:hypothetical protein
MDEGPAVGALDIVDIGPDQFLGSQTSQQTGQDHRLITLDPHSRIVTVAIGCDGRQHCLNGVVAICSTGQT